MLTSARVVPALSLAGLLVLLAPSPGPAEAQAFPKTPFGGITTGVGDLPHLSIQ